MILSCPSCATRFAIADATLAAGGRKLRCAKCRYVWQAATDGMPIAAAQTEAPSTSSTAESITMRTEMDIAAPPPRRAAPPPLPPPNLWESLDKAAAHMPRLPRRLAWVLVIFLLLLTLALGYFGRNTLAARFPRLEEFYIAIGLILPPPVESFELQLTRAEKCLISGRDMLCINGQLTNRSEMTLAPPVIYVTALNAEGKEFTDDRGHVILTWTVKSAGGKLLPGESREFDLTEPYPDRSVSDFDYGFLNDEP